MKRILGFVNMRISQLVTDLGVFEDLGPIYEEDKAKVIAILGELRGIRGYISVLRKLDAEVEDHNKGA